MRRWWRVAECWSVAGERSIDAIRWHEFMGGITDESVWVGVASFEASYESHGHRSLDGPTSAEKMEDACRGLSHRVVTQFIVR